MPRYERFHDHPTPEPNADETGEFLRTVLDEVYNSGGVIAGPVTSGPYLERDISRTVRQGLRDSVTLAEQTLARSINPTERDAAILRLRQAKKELKDYTTEGRLPGELPEETP